LFKAPVALSYDYKNCSDAPCVTLKYGYVRSFTLPDRNQHISRTLQSILSHWNIWRVWQNS